MTDGIRLIDPTPDGLRAALEEVYRHEKERRGAYYTFDPFEPAPILRSAAEAEGVTSTQMLPDWGLTAAWWTDTLGRRHHRVWSSYNESLSATPETLAWIAPTNSYGWRIRDGVPTPVVICRCGVTGPPESLAWMGDRCGPCFDRVQEGVPGPREVGGLKAVWFRLVAAVEGGGVLGRTGDGGGVSGLCYWAAVEDDAPAWELSHSEAAGDVAIVGAVMALRENDGAITLRDIRSRGMVCRIPAGMRRTDEIAWVAGADGPRLLCVEITSRKRHQLTAYDVRLSEGRWEKAWSVALEGEASLFGSPASSRFVSVGRHGMEVRDAAKGAVIEMVCTGDGRRPVAPVVLAGGTLVASHWEENGHRLARWGAAPAEAKRRPSWGWAAGAARRPDREEVARGSVQSIIAAPDGELAVLEGKDLVARCAETLVERVAFRPRPGTMHAPLAFSSDGCLLVATSEGLAVWPWRELMGRP